MQLDIFEHSRDVMLRNDVVATLRQRDATAASAAFARLANEFGTDPLLPALGVLREALSPPPPFASHAAAIAALAVIDAEVVPAAAQVFGGNHVAWLAPLWRDLATAAAGLNFQPRDEAAHAAAFLLRAGDWPIAARTVEQIAAWRRQPAPLAWMAESICRDPSPERGFAAAWPLLAELAWIAPQRFAALAGSLDLPPLTPLRQRFDREFDGTGEAGDYAWFPAWACIADATLAAGLRLSQIQKDEAPERCARLLAKILSLERQGKHAELLAARKSLRDAHAGLFSFYMQSR